MPPAKDPRFHPETLPIYVNEPVSWMVKTMVFPIAIYEMDRIFWASLDPNCGPHDPAWPPGHSVFVFVGPKTNLVDLHVVGVAKCQWGVLKAEHSPPWRDEEFFRWAEEFFRWAHQIGEDLQVEMFQFLRVHVFVKRLRWFQMRWEVPNPSFCGGHQMRDKHKEHKQRSWLIRNGQAWRNNKLTSKI